MGAPDAATAVALASAYMAARAAGDAVAVADLVTPTVTMISQRDGTVTGVAALTAYCKAKGAAPGKWGPPTPTTDGSGRVRCEGVVTWLGVRLHVAAVFGVESGKIGWVGVGKPSWKELPV